MEAESFSLRSWNQAFLVGNLEENLPLHRTPTNRELLNALLHRNRYDKLSIKNAALEISRLAESALNVPRTKINAHLQDLYDTWRGLYKQKSRTTLKSEEDRTHFRTELSMPCDLSWNPIGQEEAAVGTIEQTNKQTSSNKSDLACPSSRPISPARHRAWSWRHPQVRCHHLA
ncbi:hypothetical protein pipiens_012737 [Culex pipiens pipiens]|uniref:TFIIS N-terminal domain-containing protein n=1 Tax=Culex pipiens pipiens TaxID=38569 RepID=A0ABD1D1K8_CULPP